MVRFHWYSEDGCDCQVHPGSLTQDSPAGVLHATAELKVPGQRASVEVTFSMPEDFLTRSKSAGIFLIVGDKASSGNSRFVADFGASFSKQGYIVVCQCVKTDDIKRQQEIQKTLNACISSPYAQRVKEWVITGVGGGCQIASSIAHNFHHTLKALVFVASPLTMKIINEPEISLKAPHVASDTPVLFLHPSISECCSKEALTKRLHAFSSALMRYMTIPDVDQNFRTSKGKNAVHMVSAFAVSAIFEFLNVLDKGDLSNCLIPSIDQISESPSCDPGDPMDICSSP